MRAPLKPPQRLNALREHALSHFFHALVLGRVHHNTLAAIDKQFRRAARQTLRLPADTPVALFHPKVKDGGLGIPAAEVAEPLAKAARYRSLLASADPVLAWAAAETFAAPGQRTLRTNPTVNGSQVVDRAEATRAWASSLYRTRDGAALRDSNPVSTAWVREPISRTTPSEFLGAVALRGGVLPCGTRASRGGRGDRPPMCRGSCGRPESLTHILQGCALTHGPRVKRHDAVVHELVRRLERTPGATVLREPTVPYVGTFLRPDILVIRGTRVTVVDVAVVADGGLQSGAAEKKRKYGSPGAEAAILRLARATSPAVEEVAHVPAVWTARGLVAPTTCRELKTQLGLSGSLMRLLCWVVVRGSLSTYHQ